MSSGASRRAAKPEVLLADWILRGEEDIAALFTEHPQHAGRLRELHQHWSAVADVARALDRRASFAERLKHSHAAPMDPEISLHEGQGGSLSGVLEGLSTAPSRDGRYQMIGEVARGGMGAILEVWENDLRRKLAMKVILQPEDSEGGSSTGIDQRTLGRFLEEAQITGQLDHPGIVPVHSLGLDANGQVYFTMRLVKGRDLRHIFELVREEQEGWNPTRALGVLLKVCEAMAYAHAKGVIHRDLKPANVMVGRFGDVYVMDWGLSKVIGREDSKDLRLKSPEVSSVSIKTDRKQAADEDPETPLVTMDGTLVGTPAYMPPEQARSETEKLDRRSDVYSLGAMLYTLLAGATPYVPEGMRPSAHTVWRWVLEGPPRPVQELNPRVPAELLAICEKAMARDPDERYADTLELAVDLRAYLEGRVVGAYRTGAVAELMKWVRRNKVMAAALLLAFVALIVGIFASFTLKQRSDHNAALAAQREERALVTRSMFLADLAVQRTEAGDAATGLRLALEALPGDLDAPDRPLVPEAQAALLYAVHNLRERKVLRLRATHDTLRNRHYNTRAAFSPDGESILTMTTDSVARIWSSDGSELAAFEGHDDQFQLSQATFSRDGTRVLTASRDGTARLWTREGHELAVLRGHEHHILHAALSPDAEQVLTGSMDLTARLWDSSGLQLAVMHGHEQLSTGREMPVSQVAFSPDGSRIVTSAGAGKTVLRDADGLEITALHSGKAVRHFAFSPDGTRIATAGYDSVAVVHDPDGGVLATLEGHKRYIHHVAFNHDGSQLVTSSRDGTARVWDLSDPSRQWVMRGHEGAVSYAAFSPNGSLVVTASSDGTARIWDGEWEVGILGGHEAGVTQVDFSPDSAKILTASHDGTVRLWDVEASVRFRRGGSFNYIREAMFSPDGSKFLIVPVQDLPPQLYKRDGEPITLLQGHESGLRHAEFSPDGKTILTASDDGTARLWNLEGNTLAVLRGHGMRVYHAEFSPDGSRIVTASLDQTARVWDADGLMHAVLRGHAGYVAHATFSADGQHVVTASGDGTARVWDVDGLELAILQRHEKEVTHAEFSPDGNHIVTASEDHTARLWTLEGDEIAVLRHGDVVRHATFNSDGHHILTASFDNTARVWDLDGRSHLVLNHPSNVLNAHFSSNDSLILTCGGGIPGIAEQNAARIWDSEGRIVAILLGHTERVNTVHLSPDGKHAITSSKDNSVRIFPLILGQKLIDHARSIAPRELTQTQREEFFLDVDRVRTRSSLP